MMNGAIVGFGVVARHGHWPAYQASSEARIVAVVEPLADRRALAEATIPGVHACASIDQLPAGIDFVDVCTPPALHAGAVLAALDRDCHVLCEKPLVLRGALMDEIRARAEARGRAVVPAHNWKYAPILRRAAEILRSGRLGALRRVEIVTSRTHAAVPASGSDYNWRTDPDMSGGGILMDHGWHSVYLALDWFAERPTAVEATLSRPPGGGVEDEAAVTIHFPSGDAHVALTWRGASRRNAATLICEAGTIVADDDRLHVSGRETRSELMAAALSAGSHHADWFTAMLPDVVAAFREPSRSRALLDEAALCLAVIEQAYAVATSPTVA